MRLYFNHFINDHLTLDKLICPIYHKNRQRIAIFKTPCEHVIFLLQNRTRRTKVYLKTRCVLLMFLEIDWSYSASHRSIAVSRLKKLINCREKYWNCHNNWFYNGWYLLVRNCCFFGNVDTQKTDPFRVFSWNWRIWIIHNITIPINWQMTGTNYQMEYTVM